MSESKPMNLEAGVESPPQFDRVADVLGPLEQIVLAADQELGTIQRQVVSKTGESAAEIERRVRESALEQRQRVAELRGELTQRVTELAGRFDALLAVLDEADRELAGWAGEPADLSVTVTERQRVQISHETPPAGRGTRGAPGCSAAPGREGCRQGGEAGRQAGRKAGCQAGQGRQVIVDGRPEPDSPGRPEAVRTLQGRIGIESARS